MSPLCSSSLANALPVSLTKEVMVDDRLVTMQVSVAPIVLFFVANDKSVMGYSGSGTFSIIGRGFLPWRRLLRIGV